MPLEVFAAKLGVYIYIYIYICTCIYIYICVCGVQMVCVSIEGTWSDPFQILIFFT